MTLVMAMSEEGGWESHKGLVVGLAKKFLVVWSASYLLALGLRMGSVSL